MRGLLRNKQPIWYANYLGKTEIIDANGNRTGEFTESYSDPVKIMVNLAPAKGYVDWSPFGIYTPYDIAAMTLEMDLPITEKSVIWIGIPTTEHYNYVVVRIARSLNNVIYALRGVGDAD